MEDIVSLVLVLVTIALVALDQLIKYLVVVFLKPVGTTTIIPKVLAFTYLENDGAAFSIFSGKQIFLIIITAIALLVWAYFLFFKRPKEKLEVIGMVLVLAGGIGNLIDRVANGFVVDYVEFLFVRFAVFNLADIFVTIGFIILVIGVFKSEKKNKEINRKTTGSAVEKTEEKNGNS